MGEPAATDAACRVCRRRCWLLGELSARLDYGVEDRDALMALMALGDAELIQAVGGRRRAELREAYARLDVERAGLTSGVAAVCTHDRRYPPRLRDVEPPPMLNVAGDLERVAELLARATVAIVGSGKASDYGAEVASSIARGLTASGVTVISTLCDGISLAAHEGALQVDGPSLAVIAGGLDAGVPVRRRSLFGRIVANGGCALTELPCGSSARRWSHAAAERIVAALASVTVLVEAPDSERDLLGARLAGTLGRPLAAVPGRVTSPLSSGPHALLSDGSAELVRGAGDVLELLYGLDAAPREDGGGAFPGLEPRLRSILESVGEGRDTPDKLTADGADTATVLLALSELEVRGLLARGEGSRYLLRQPFDARRGE